MPYLELEDIKLYYEVKGIGEPLILIPGLSGTCDAFSLISHDLAKKYKVVSLDNRGSGRSLPLNNAFTVKTMAEDLSHLIDSLGFGKVNLLGHSMGGFIVQEYLLNNAEKVNKVILSNTSCSCTYRNMDIFKCLMKIFKQENLTECWHRIFSHWIYTPDFINALPDNYEGAIEFSMNYRYHQKPESFEAQAIACMNFKTPLESQVSNQTLIICGEKDILILPEESFELKKYFTAAKVTVLPKAAHLPMIENSEEYTKIILDFLSSY